MKELYIGNEFILDSDRIENKLKKLEGDTRPELRFYAFSNWNELTQMQKRQALIEGVIPPITIAKAKEFNKNYKLVPCGAFVIGDDEDVFSLNLVIDRYYKSDIKDNIYPYIKHIIGDKFTEEKFNEIKDISSKINYRYPNIYINFDKNHGAGLLSYNYIYKENNIILEGDDWFQGYTINNEDFNIVTAYTDESLLIFEPASWFVPLQNVIRFIYNNYPCITQALYDDILSKYNNIITRLEILESYNPVKILTQAEYDDLETKDDNVLYITDDPTPVATLNLDENIVTNDITEINNSIEVENSEITNNTKEDGNII